jgi:signal transduction histidine kinase
MSTVFILENSLDLFYVVTDTDGNIVSTNELFKHYASHIKPKNIIDIVSNPEDKDTLIEAIKRAKDKRPEPTRVYARTKQKNASERFNVWNIYSIMGAVHFIGFQLVDVTSISAHEHERQRVLLEEFRFMLSHELRQPLTSVSGLVKLLINNRSISEGERGDLMQMLEQSVVNLDEAVKVLVKKAARQI